MKGLVLGFGSFDLCEDNPSARIAAALHARGSEELELVGVEMPVSYARSIEVTHRWIHRTRPSWVLGIGVAMSREEPTFERYGTGESGERLDVDGQRRVPGAPLHEAVYAERFAAHLGCKVSGDAGTYVCNAWLNETGRAYALLPVNFLHVPRIGIDPDVLFAALLAVSTEVR